MANFVAYSTRIGSRKVGTLHVVGAYAAGAYSVIFNREGTGHEFLQTEASDGRYGWTSPDYVSVDKNYMNAAPVGYLESLNFYGFGYGVYELVGIQPFAIFNRSAQGAIIKIAGDALANYIEKTEHRYLSNGHIMIKVYFNDDALKDFFGPRDTLIVAANALLQTGTALGSGELETKKKRVPFMLAMPSLTGSDTDVQNPTIDVEKFLYSDPTGSVPETGFTVRVENMGFNETGLEWNTSRTYTNFQGDSGMGLPESQADDGSDAYYPHFGNFIDAGSKGAFKNRHIDTSRSQGTIYTPSHFNAGELNIHTGSGDTFDIREMTSPSTQGFGSKQPWGRHAGLLHGGGIENDSDYYGGSTGVAPFLWGADAYTNAMSATLNFYGENVSGPAGPFQETLPGPQGPDVSMDGYFFGAHFDVHGNRRNPFYPVYGSCYGTYVDFYKWEGFNTTLNGSNGYLPANISGQGVSTFDEWPFYIADTFRAAFASHTITSTVTDAINNLNEDSFFAPYAGGSPISFVRDHRMSWQDYIGTCVNASSMPFTDVSGNITSGFTINGCDSSKPMMQPSLMKMSGLMTLSSWVPEVHLMYHEGRSMSPSPEYEYPDTITINPTATNLAEDGTLFKYTVFVYADQPMPRLAPPQIDCPLGPAADNTSQLIIMENGALYYAAYQQYDSGFAIGQNVIEENFPNGTRYLTLPNYNWSNGGIITNKCVDRNSDVSALYYDNNTSNFLLGNCNACSESSYSRCGCENIVEEYAEGELVNLNEFGPGDNRRFETIITCPRPITTHFTDVFSSGGSNSYPSIYYINSFYNAVNTTSTINSTFASSYLSGGTSTNLIDFKVDGTTNTSTNTLSSLGLSDYEGSIWNDVFDNLSTDSNTFHYLYMPGREPFEDAEGFQYFVHDTADFARVFATIGGTGSSDGDPTNDLEHRQILLFEASESNTAATDSKRAHGDLRFCQENWKDASVEASFISLAGPKDCTDSNKDQPVRRVRKFVTVNAVNRDTGIDDGGDGGDDGNGGNNVYGCTDEDAVNYDPSANADDGSCIECDSSFADHSGDPEGLPDPFHVIPLLYDTKGHNQDSKFQGAASETTNYGNTPAPGTTGAFTKEVTVPAGTHPSETYDWWDGNVINAFNTRGVAESGLGALNSGNEPLADLVGNTAKTFFRLQIGAASIPTPGLGTNTAAANHASMLQYGNTDHAQDFLDLWGSIQGAESPGNMTLAVFNYSDWETNTIPIIPNKNLGNNGWAVDTWSGQYVGTNQARTNVFHDTSGDYTGIGLGGVSPVYSFSNQQTGTNPFGLVFGNHSFLGGPIAVADAGLEAGKQYVAIVRFRPKNACGNKSVYYWAYNFWVKYCTCTDPLSLNFGEANPTGLDTYPFYGSVHEAHSPFPGVNSPNSGVNNTNGDATSFNALPNDFCNGFTEDFTDSTGGNSGSKLCVVDEDTEVDCADFASWCLSDIIDRCETDPLDPLQQYGVLSFNILIDGFFGQSEIDAYQLYYNPDPQNGNSLLQYYYRVDVYLEGETNPEYTIYSHNYENSVWSANPQVTIQNSGGPDNYGEFAQISVPEITWDQDTDGDNVTDPLTFYVELTYLGIVNMAVPSIADLYSNSYPDYVVNAPCSTYTLSYTSDFSDCIDLLPGCLDPLANNFNPNATFDDGSCTYIGCDEIWSQARNSVFITEIETTNDELLCADVDIDPTDPSQGTYNQYTPQYSGTMKITIDDFSVAQLGANGLEGNFSIGIIHLDNGSLNTVGGMLDAYAANITAIQADIHPSFESVPALNGVFLPPDLDNPANTTVTSIIDGQSYTGQRYVTEVPVGAINGGSDNLSAAVSSIPPYIDYSVLKQKDLVDCRL